MEIELNYTDNVHKGLNNYSELGESGTAIKPPRFSFMLQTGWDAHLPGLIELLPEYPGQGQTRSLLAHSCLKFSLTFSYLKVSFNSFVWTYDTFENNLGL